MLLADTNNSDEEVIERICYVCGLDLMQEYKKDNSQQNDLNASRQKFPTMTLWNGKKEELCSSCYKNHVEGIKIYQEKHPEWEYPKAKEW